MSDVPGRPNRVPQSLSKKLDQVNTIIREAEAAFSAVFIFPARVSVMDGWLWYKRLGGKDRLAIEFGGAGGIVPIENAAIEYRVAAVGVLEKLWKACEDAIVVQEKVTDEALVQGSEFLKKLRGESE